MALIIAGMTRCALCDGLVQEGDGLVATSHFIGDREHRLWRYSDAAMHRACFLAWEHREEFVELYNATVPPQLVGKAVYHQMDRDGSLVPLDERWASP